MSGDGLHVIVRGEWRSHRNVHRITVPGAHPEAKVEVYGDRNGKRFSAGRYFTVSGHTLPGSGSTFVEAQGGLDKLASSLFPPPQTRPRPSPIDLGDENHQTILDDDELIRKAKSAKNGDRFARLWAGDSSDYGGDESRGDLAFCRILAFWTRCDPVRMDRLFRLSGRMREKWNSRRGDTTYGAITIGKAIEGCTELYEPVTDDRTPTAEAPKGRDSASVGDKTPRKYGNVEVSSPSPSLARTDARTHVYRPFPIGALPEPVRRYVGNAAEAIGCDPSYVALPMLSGLAAAVGNTRRVMLKQGWTEPAIVWTAIVGESGTLKSPALELALRPVRARQHDAMRRYTEDIKRYEQELVSYERNLSQWKRSKASDEAPVKPEQPRADRCWTDDVTTEALAVLLLHNPRGLLMVRDELAGWFDFDRYTGKGGDVARWLEMFGGRPLVVDRKGGGSLYVPGAAVSIAGGIQPDALRRSLGIEHRENGLAARLLLACPPRKAKFWTEVDLDPQVGESLSLVFDRLYALSAETSADGTDRPRLVHLDDSAKAAWIAFYNEHAAEQSDLTGDLAAAWSKLEGYAARLALLVHLVRCVTGVVHGVGGDPVPMEEESVRAGVTLSRWFATETARVYQILAETPEARERRRLIEWISRRGGAVSARDLTRGPRTYRADSDAAECALADLVAHGLAVCEDVEPGSPGGRPTRLWKLVACGDGDETSRMPGKIDVSSPTTGELGTKTLNEAADPDQDTRL